MTSEAFSGLALVGIAAFDVDRGCPHVRGSGDGKESEPACTDYGDRRAGVSTAYSHGVPGDCGGFHDGSVADGEASRDGYKAVGGYSVLLGHAAVDGDAEGPVGVRRAEVVSAAATLCARATAVHRLDNDCSAVGVDTGDLVPEDTLEPVADIHQVRAADARRPDVDDLAYTRRVVDFVDDHVRGPVAGTAHGLHGATLP